MLIKVETKIDPGTLKDMTDAPGYREQCMKLAEFFTKLGGGLLPDAELTVVVAQAKPLAEESVKAAPVKKAAKKVTKKKAGSQTS